jgi:hypothetical protein
LITLVCVCLITFHNQVPCNGIPLCTNMNPTYPLCIPSNADRRDDARVTPYGEGGAEMSTPLVARISMRSGSLGAMAAVWQQSTAVSWRRSHGKGQK